MSGFFQAALLGMGYASFLFIIPCVFVTIVCYELSKSFTAKRLGCLVSEKISLNPFKYISVFGFILMSLTNYGWGKAQECDVDRLPKSKKVLYYFSGSIGCIICALVFLLLQAIVHIIMCLGGISGGFLYNVQDILCLFVWVPVSMAVTQLIPIPGFAGYSILKALFFEKAHSNALRAIEQNGKWIFTVIVLIGVMRLVSEFLSGICYDGLIFAEKWLVDIITNGQLSEILENLQ